MLSVKGMKRHIGKLRGVGRVANSLYWKILPNKNITFVVWGCISNFTFRPKHIHASIMPLQILNSKIYISCAILNRELSFEEKKGTPPPYRAPTNTHAILYWINNYNPFISNVKLEYCRFVHIFLMAIFLIYPWINTKCFILENISLVQKKQKKKKGCI